MCGWDAFWKSDWNVIWRVDPCAGAGDGKPLELQSGRSLFCSLFFFSFLFSVFCRDLRKVEEVLDESLYKRWDILTDPAALSAQVIMK